MDWISNSAGRILESVESNPFPFLGPLQGLWAPTRSLLPTRLHVDISSQHWFEKSHTTSWRRQWQPTPVFLPGKSNGQRSLVGCSPWGCEESDTTEWLHFHFSLSCIGEGNGNPLQCSCLENPRDGGAWWAAVYGVAQSWTRLKWLSSSRLIIAFLPKSKRLLISWFQSPSAVILEPKKIKSATVSTVSPSICCEVMELDTMIFFFSECWVLSQLFHSPLSLSSRGSLVPLHFLL